MPRTRTVLAAACAASLVLGAAPAATAGPAADRGRVTVIARNLDNPRGVAVAADGAVYVAEAGRGGDGPCVAVPGGDQLCYGATGAVTRVGRGGQARVASGLPSLASPGGAYATGPHDVAAVGGRRVDLVVGLGLLLDAWRELGPVGASLGRVQRLAPGARPRTLADIARYEERVNPDGGQLESNPYALLHTRRGMAVVDAAGNALLHRDRRGRLTTLATFPERLVDAPPELGAPPGTRVPMQAVPTAVAVGPDGAYYVGELTGFPYPVGGARIYRVPPGGGQPRVWATGFTAIVDLTFAADGSLYVLEIAANGLLDAFQTGRWRGALLKVSPGGRRTELVPGRLDAPAGLAVARGGALVVSHRSLFPGEGELLRVSTR
jgi:adhesin HecA-like repeat protein